ncbi:phage integrase family protein [Nostoc sp. FACHB-152]|uniref:tyrosine-type recombinase/integrase n=1 Tax=unclassified Nostoc TaxID=2593658 RepID=UPI0016842CBC|nr:MULTISPECIES: tyrosine-type recombinase/integrase [unclassified Nostoc]MBD2451170.1 phage integrase family protein [Nostoc sp. FACHB-152]MBD2472975.1 phage integrase family protein [Nostoc sp. FACHB-145]
MSTNTVTSLVLTSTPPLTQHPAIVYLSKLSPGSKPTMKHSLNLIAQLLTQNQADYLTLNWSGLRYKHTTSVRATLIKNYKPATVNRILCALRGALKSALLLELINPIDYARAIDIKSVKVSQEGSRRVLNQNEIDALMHTCFSDLTPAGFRDAALIALLRGAGLRRAEVVGLDKKDFHHHGEIKICSAHPRVERTVYLSKSALAIVNDWIEIRTLTDGPLLCQVNKSGRVVYQRLTPQAVLFILHKRGEQAGIKPFSPHDLRQTFIWDLLNAGVDISTVQSLAGLSNPATTTRYKHNFRTEERSC